MKREDLGKPVEHHDPDRDADDRQADQVGDEHPDSGCPPADQNEPNRADPKRALLRPPVGDGRHPVTLDDRRRLRPGAQGQERSGAIEDPERQWKPDYGQRRAIADRQ